jgi:hypothetical protein
MATKTWKDISKFRLFTMVSLSLLTSLSLSITDELWRVKDIILALLHAGITAFAYLQCPTLTKDQKKEGEE